MENGREDKKIKSKNRIREKFGLSAIEATRLANVDIDGGDRRVKHDPTADCVSRILYAMMMSNLIYLYWNGQLVLDTSSRTLFVREDLCRDVHVTSSYVITSDCY